ncbi:hypothetical protein Taro_040509 [Colocasia esculenta]|uniref:Uncharacterized protein n=1 Tax=Colocasia esculenta TaxID=4460 RepID=A0A843WC23_COLES|nr:hypothetical protein [Colocasia esculenta]
MCVLVGVDSADGVGHALELVLGGGELLLEGDVGGSEALVVNEEALDLLVLRREPLLDDGRVERPRGRAAAAAEGPLPHVVEEGGVRWAGEGGVMRDGRLVQRPRGRGTAPAHAVVAPPRHRGCPDRDGDFRRSKGKAEARSGWRERERRAGTLLRDSLDLSTDVPRLSTTDSGLSTDVLRSQKLAMGGH